MKTLMQIALVIVAGALGLILWTIISRGFPAMSWEMIYKVPKADFTWARKVAF